MAIFLCIIMSILLVSILLIEFSTLRINIKEFEVLNTKILKFKLEITLNLFNKLPWLKLNLDEKKTHKFSKNEKIKILNKILQTRVYSNYKNIRKIVIKDFKKIIQWFENVEVKKVNIKTDIGAKNADTTAYFTSAVAIAIPIILGRKAEKLSYKVEPKYINKNYVFLSLNCIIVVKLVHIISITKNMTKGHNRKEVYQ